MTEELKHLHGQPKRPPADNEDSSKFTANLENRAYQQAENAEQPIINNQNMLNRIKRQEKQRSIKLNPFNVINDDDPEQVEQFTKDFGFRARRNGDVFSSNETHVPFDIETVNFFSSFVRWSNDNEETDLTVAGRLMNKLLNNGYVVVYHAEQIIDVTEYEPVFTTSGELFGLITDEDGMSLRTSKTRYIKPIGTNEIKTIDGSSSEFLAVAEVTNLDDYFVIQMPNHAPIYWDAVGLINAYDISLQDNENSLRRFAESILILSGVTNTRNLSDEELMAVGQSFVMNFIPPVNGDGSYGPTPSASFIAPPINTEAREAWSTRIRMEIYEAVHLPDFKNFGGQVSTDTMRIKMYPTIQRATMIADYIIEDMKLIFGEGLTYEVDLLTSQNDNMQAVDKISFVSQRTKIELAFPDWDEKRVETEINRLGAEDENVLNTTAMNSLLKQVDSDE